MKLRHYSHKPLAVSNNYYAIDIAKLYNFPLSDGAGQTIGIIELGGGYSLSDLHTYAMKLNLPPINITTISVDGGMNNPSDQSGANDEVMLDIEIVYTLVPKAAIRVYFAPNTDQGFIDAIHQAVLDKCNIISISWGAAEDQWNSTSVAKFEQALQNATNNNVSVFAAAGDAGAFDDGTKTPTVDYPGSSQFVCSTGGTEITDIGEIVWNNLSTGDGASGGGESSLFSRPDWQTKDHIDKVNRSVPDLTANASPLTGYNIIVDGQWIVLGGTSATAPLYAALFARLNKILGKNIGNINPIIYALNERSWYDVTQGNNGYWIANTNYDLTSGLGRLKGDTLVEDISWVIDQLNRNIVDSNIFYSNWGYVPKLVKITYHFDDKNPTIYENKKAQEKYKISFTPTQCSWSIDTAPNIIPDWDYISKNLGYNIII